MTTAAASAAPADRAQRATRGAAPQGAALHVVAPRAVSAAQHRPRLNECDPELLVHRHELARAFQRALLAGEVSTRQFASVVRKSRSVVERVEAGSKPLPVEWILAMPERMQLSFMAAVETLRDRERAQQRLPPELRLANMTVELGRIAEGVRDRSGDPGEILAHSGRLRQQLDLFEHELGEQRGEGGR